MAKRRPKKPQCPIPNCGSKKVILLESGRGKVNGRDVYECQKCGCTWQEPCKEQE